MLSFIVLYVMYPHTLVQCVCTLFNFGCTYCIYQFFLELEKILTVLVDCSDFRDSFYLCLLNSGTSFLSGFAIFSVLGYMSQKQGVDINSVAESGMKVIQFCHCYRISCLTKQSFSIIHATCVLLFKVQILGTNGKPLPKLEARI